MRQGWEPTEPNPGVPERWRGRCHLAATWAFAKDCGAGCPLLAHVEGGRLVRITDNPLKAPHMTGCVRGYQMPRVVYAPDRLRAPLIRAGARGSGQFREASWEEALSLAAERLGDIRARHGSQAVLRLGGSGSCRGAVHNTSGLLSRFLAFFGGATTTYSSYSSAASSFVTPFVYGTPLTGLDPSTLPHARMIVLWGANLADLRFGCETESWLQEAKDGGTEIVVIDPRRTRTMDGLAPDARVGRIGDSRTGVGP